jgi:hypothetical protein
VVTVKTDPRRREGHRRPVHPRTDRRLLAFRLTAAEIATLSRLLRKRLLNTPVGDAVRARFPRPAKRAEP